MLAKCTSILFFFLLLQTKIFGQETTYFPIPDTLRLDLKQVEKLFLDSNLQLLAMRYNILSATELVEQAKKWDNPILNTDQNLYNQQEGFFKHGTVYNAQGNAIQQGEVYADIEQLIRTAGKRRKMVAIASTNVNLVHVQFNAVMRSLRFTLITYFNTLSQLQGNAVMFTDNLDWLTKLTNSMQPQLQNGSITKKEFLRVQALKIAVEQNLTENSNYINDAEAELKTILRIKGNFFLMPVIRDTEIISMPAYTIAQIIDSAKKHNSEYQAQKYELQLQKQVLGLQKVLAVPDVMLGLEIDQHSAYIPHYFGLNIGFPLPIFDRNQGNIKSAKYQLLAEETNLQQLDIKLENDVIGAYKKLYNAIKLNTSINKQFYKDYYDTYIYVADAFSKRKIDLLEFLDFFDDYQETSKQQLQQVFNFQMAKADLNDIVGIDIVQ
jgi:cobalt-zinc-cadmium efflux system outer membrane protein